jgi:hypothetical protein
MRLTEKAFQQLLCRFDASDTISKKVSRKSSSPALASLSDDQAPLRLRGKSAHTILSDKHIRVSVRR